MKELKHHLIFITTIASFSIINAASYLTCYETYCLFSFGPNVTVNNVKEAQKICKDAKLGSWLLEIVDVKVSRNVNKFLSEHSFPENTKLILNVERQEGKWMWIKNRAEINNTNGVSLHHDGDITFYQPRNRTRKSNFEKDNFTILCMAGNFTKHKGKMFLYGFHHKAETMVGCLKKCENSECVAWEWDHKSGCWIHKTIKEKIMTDNEYGDLYILNRSLKSPDIYVGNKTSLQTAEERADDMNRERCKATIAFSIIPWILLVLLIVAITAVILFRKKYKNRRNIALSGSEDQNRKTKTSKTSYAFVIPNSTQEGETSSSSTPVLLSSHQAEQSNMESLVYADMSNLPKKKPKPNKTFRL